MTYEEFLRWEKASRDTIDFKVIYVDMAGDILAGILLSQIVYWFLPSKDGASKLRVKKDGKMWIARKLGDWWNECRLTEKQTRRALGILNSRNLVDVEVYKFAGVPTTHIRLSDGFLTAFEAALNNAQSDEEIVEQEEQKELASPPVPEGSSICPPGQVQLPYRASPPTETTNIDYTENSAENPTTLDTVTVGYASPLSTKVKGVNAPPSIPIQEEEESNVLSLKENRHTKPITENGIVIRKTRGNETQSTQRAANQPMPPAIAVYRSEVHRYPPKSWYNDISQVVGEDSDNLAHWKEVLHYWLGRGWNPTNIAGMLEAYKGDSGGTPPGAQNGVGKEEKAQERKQVQWSSVLLE